MKKSIYLTILSIVTTVCILFGSVIHIFRWNSNVNRFVEELFGKDSAITQFFQNDIDETMVSYSEDIEAFDSIEMDLSVMDVTIEKGDTWHLEYECPAFVEPKIEVDNETLIIKEPSNKGKNVKECWLVLTVPQDLEDVTIENEVGDVALTGIYIEQLEADADVGNITLQNCGGNVSLTADVGGVEVSCEDESGADVSNDDVSNDDEDTSYETIEIYTSVGDASVSKVMFRDLTINGDVGDIDVQLADAMKEEMSDYHLDIFTDLGNVEVNGKNQKREYSINEDAQKEIVLTTDIGDIVVE